MEFQNGKAILTEKRDEIDKFEKYVTAITRMFIANLEDNQNITETVRTEFDALLKSKDSIIQELQSNLSIAEQNSKEALQEAENYKDENARLKSSLNSLENEYHNKTHDMQTMITDKDNLNKVLSDTCNELNTKIESIKQEHKKMLEMSKEVSQLNEKIKTLENKSQTQQLESEKYMLQLKKQYNEDINSLREKHLEEINKYQLKFRDLLEQRMLPQKDDLSNA